MTKTISLSLLTTLSLFANDVQLSTINVEATQLSDVAKEEIKSGDLSQTLANKIPTISMVRRSGIANDIILRGQKKDNINILIDDGKIYGACPNRMDPATSHILTNNIETINVIEGPYDVANFGTLSGAVKIATKKPSKEFAGEVNLNTGSYNYRKASFSAEGGTEKVKLLLSGSYETSDQYEDGSGDTFAEQLINKTANTQEAGTQYIKDDNKAYEKKTLMAKLFVDISDDQELVASYTRNESDAVLYPSSKMDADYDNSNLYNIEYKIKNIASFSKELLFNYYNSSVDHPMSTTLRKSSLMMGTMTSALRSSIQGAKVTNKAELTDSLEMRVGLDGSLRNWDGEYKKNGVAMNIKSIDNVDTKNMALFTELEQKFTALTLEAGLRLDYTTITSASATQKENSYKNFSANLLARYKTNENLSFFAGAGKASRVPDARELYFLGMKKNEVGSNDLDDTENYEVDLGMQNSYSNFTMKTKLFYSYLKDYIYYNSSSVNAMGMSVNAFENINATLYGFDISGTYYMMDELYTNFGMAYQRGKKSEALTKQSDKDLAEIAPLKGNIAINYEYMSDSIATLEVLASDKWRNYDSDNGEQAIDGWSVLNAKVVHTFSENFEGTLGVDNMMNKVYAQSNTYQDLTLIGTSVDKMMLLNEMGRYFYANVKVSW